MTKRELEALAADIRLERDAIARSVADMAEAALAAGAQPSRVALWACGGTLHAFYTGIEKSLETIADSIDQALPAGPDWHRRLLRQVSAPRPDLRPAVLCEATVLELEDYLAFRHRYRNLYMFDLRWEPMRALLDRAPAVWARVADELEAFAGYLEQLGREVP
jgi:hypothetical protein